MEKLHLRKLLQLFYADRGLRRSVILAEIRTSLRKKLDLESSGGDFYVPFWADAKDHVAGKLDLREQSKIRTGKSKQRGRLYPLLTESFLSLWNEKIRFRNEEFEFLPASVKAQLPIKELGVIVKIENIVAVKVWDGSKRVIYPYFSENPALPTEGARLGLWALKEALPDFRAEDFRIIDILRRSYFRPNKIPMKGDERETFVEKYDSILAEWRKLRDER